MGDVNKSTRVQLSRAQKHGEWIQLYVGGATYQQIADIYEVSVSNIKEVIARQLSDAQSRRAHLADHALNLYLERLETLLAAHWPTATKTLRDDDGNPVAVSNEDADRAARFIVRVLDREAKLFGFDEPQRVDITVRAGDDLDDELRRLIGQIGAAANASGQPLPPILDSIATEVAALPAETDTDDDDTD